MGLCLLVDCVHYSGDQIKENEMGGVYACTGIKTAYTALEQKTKQNMPLGRPRHRWEDNIKMALKEIGWEGIDWIKLAQDS
jgi:hypothetical protein